MRRVEPALVAARRDHDPEPRHERARLERVARRGAERVAVGVDDAEVGRVGAASDVLAQRRAGSAAPARRSARAARRRARRRGARSSGTSTKRGSPYQRSRSENASFTDSASTWRYAAVLWPSAGRSKPVEDRERLQQRRPLAPRVGRVHEPAAVGPRHRRRDLGAERRHVLHGEPAAAGAVELDELPRDLALVELARAASIPPRRPAGAAAPPARAGAARRPPAGSRPPGRKTARVVSQSRPCRPIENAARGSSANPSSASSIAGAATSAKSTSPSARAPSATRRALRGRPRCPAPREARRRSAPERLERGLAPPRPEAGDAPHLVAPGRARTRIGATPPKLHMSGCTTLSTSPPATPASIALPPRSSTRAAASAAR